MNFLETATLMNEAIQSSVSPTVQAWLTWMNVIFALSIVFAYWKKTARYLILTLLLVASLSVVIYHYTEQVHLLGASHILLWPWLMWYCYKNDFKGAPLQFKGFYNTWLMLLMSTMSISLVFDVRDVFLVLMGLK